MMNELQPNVAEGFKEACFAIFGGGPFITDLQVALSHPFPSDLSAISL